MKLSLYFSTSSASSNFSEVRDPMDLASSRFCVMILLSFFWDFEKKHVYCIRGSFSSRTDSIILSGPARRGGPELSTCSFLAALHVLSW